MRIEHLYYFKRLAEALNYTQAAKDLYITQPALSTAIKRMEEELGFSLFYRQGTKFSKISLSPQGQVFYEYVCLALSSYERGIALAQEYEGQQSSELKIGTLYAIQGQFWSRALEEYRTFSSYNPEFSIRQAFSKALIAQLKKGNLDVVFSAKVDGKEDKDLNYTVCWSQPLVAAINKQHPLAKRAVKQDFISVADLADETILSYRQSSPVYTSLGPFLERHNITVSHFYDDEITLCSLVSSDENQVALLCYSFLVNAFEDVICVPIKEAPMDFHKLYLVSRNETHSKVLQEFIDFMSKYRFPNILQLRN